ncbi:MAG: hypothetical protein IPP51_09635 [Bacteroidetes bacterium]|nr:hypothetical protein [Bacteroidota bacterium]
MANAVEYIFNKAQQLGKPCVINASLGDYIGSHDGLDLESQYISNLLNQQAGRALVAAAGNVGCCLSFPHQPQFGGWRYIFQLVRLQCRLWRGVRSDLCRHCKF